MSQNNKIQGIIPTITKDYLRMRHIQPERVIKNLPVGELIFIGNRELCDIVDEDAKDRFRGLPIRTLNEEELVERQPVVDHVKERAEKIKEGLASPVRPGWYYQQFLKMAFSDVCDGDYYISWDMDTVPLRKISLFDREERPVFHIKSEYNPGYFKTISNLLGLEKNIEGSFISEHMVFNREYMKEMIATINGSSGKPFWKVIIDAIDEDYITLGYSEFETYGTYVTEKYPDAYAYGKYDSFRRGSWFVSENEFSAEDENWLAADYDAISFENTDQIPDMVKLFRDNKYRSSMSARKFYETILESGYFGEYKNGRIEAGDWYAPV